jgi:hypothetical protein
MEIAMKLRLLNRPILAAALVAAAFVFPAGAVAPASARPRATGWTVVPSPNPSSQANYLSAVAAVSPTDVWAVGSEYRPISTPGTLTEHWDGSTWRLVPSPNFNQGYNELYGAAAISSSDVWAVGFHNISSYESEKSMALHWNGTAWSIVPTRNIGQDANVLMAVAGVASNDVWAVGFGHSSSNQVGVPLIQHWDGTRWSLVRSPRLGRGFASLSGIVAVATDDVWAVGSHDGATLIEHWNGTAWLVVSSPNGARPDNELYAVSASGPNDVWAVGETTSNGKGDTLVEHWDGTAWTLVSAKEGSKPFTALYGVVALGSSDVWAVGADYDPLLVSYRTFTEHWDGTAWTVVPSPNPSPEYDYLVGVAGFPGGDVWAVGAADEATLILRNTG